MSYNNSICLYGLRAHIYKASLNWFLCIFVENWDLQNILKKNSHEYFLRKSNNFDAKFILLFKNLYKNLLKKFLWIHILKYITSNTIRYHLQNVLVCLQLTDILWRTRVVWFKSNLLLSSQMYNMLSLHKYN